MKRLARSESWKKRIGQNTPVQHVARAAVVDHPVFRSNVLRTGNRSIFDRSSRREISKFRLNIRAYSSSCTQVVFVYHVCVCYHCFDSLLCILNLHTASQFRILQHRFANTCNEKRGKRDEDEESALSFYEYSKLKAYIRQHQALIEYCKKLEQVFNSIVFGQVLLFSLLMCLDGYLILMVHIFIFQIFSILSLFRELARNFIYWVGK